MINVSQSIKNACNSYSVTYREYIIIDSNKIIIKGNLSDDSYNNGNFIGTFIMKKLEFETENNIDYKKKEFEYYREVNGESFKVGSFIVTDIENSDTNETVKVTSYDYALKFADTYVTELNYSSLDVTIKDVLREIRNKLNIGIKNINITNGNFIVDSNQFSNTAQYGDVIKAIAQISGTFAKINENDKLEFIFNKQTDEIIEDYEELDDKRDTRPITIVSLNMSDVEGENVTLRWEEGIEQYGENYLVISDNPFAYTQDKRAELIQGIFNKVKGFGYSSFETKNTFKPYLQCGDLVKLKNKNGDLIDSIVLRINAESNNITLSAPSVTDATVQYEQPLDSLNLLKRTEYIVDKEAQKITQIVERQDKYEDKLSEIEVSLDGISQKVETVADLTRETTGNKTITLTDCVAGNLLKLQIFGNNRVFDFLYPADNLYPADDLFPGGNSYITVTDEDGTVKQYDLGVDEVLRQNGDVQDEYILENNQAKVIRRINSNGSIKAVPTEENLGEFKIELKDGKNIITIKTYNAIIKARYAIKNSYTDIFATKVEMESSITQTAEEINLEVRKKVDENEIISTINQSAEKIQINANKVSLER